MIHPFLVFCCGKKLKRDLRIKPEDFPKLYRLTVLALSKRALHNDKKGEEYAKTYNTILKGRYKDET